MRILGALVLAGVIIVPVLADDKEKPDKDTPEKAAPAVPNIPAPAAEKWVTVFDTIGTLSKVNGGSITVKVEDQAANAQAAMQRLQQMLRSKGRSRSGGGGGAVQKKMKDVDFLLADDVKVRVGAPPVEFDDKGNLKKYSGEELKALKGGEKTWGFAADTTQLKSGDVVRVVVGRKKMVGGNKKDAPPDEPMVKMIFILKEGQEKGGGGDRPKK